MHFQSSKLEMHFAYQSGTTKYFQSFGNVLRVPDWHYKVRFPKLELWKYFAYQTGTTKLQFSSWSFGHVLRVPVWHYKVRFSSWSFGNALRVPDWHYKVASFGNALRVPDWHYKVAGALEMYFAYQTAFPKLRLLCSASLVREVHFQSSGYFVVPVWYAKCISKAPELCYFVVPVWYAKCISKAPATL